MKAEEWGWALLTMFSLTFLVATLHLAWLLLFVIGAWGLITTEHTPGS